MACTVTIMTLSSGILAGCINGQVWVRVDGKGSHQNSRELKAFVLEKAASARGQRVIVDLASCTGMDSTFMGMLTCLAARLEDSASGLHVIHAAGRNGELLRGLGLDQMFTVDDHEEHLGEAPVVPNCADLPKEPCAREERVEICLECHEALVAVDERNAPKFRDVIELMRADRRPVMAL
jgi:anti-sigma B factor antagonist